MFPPLTLVQIDIVRLVDFSHEMECHLSVVVIRGPYLLKVDPAPALHYCNLCCLIHYETISQNVLLSACCMHRSLVQDP